MSKQDKDCDHSCPWRQELGPLLAQCCKRLGGPFPLNRQALADAFVDAMERKTEPLAGTR